MLISSAGLLIFFYLLLRVVLQLPINRGLKTVTGVLLLIFSQQHFFYRHFLGSMASPELPFPLLFFSTGTFVCLLFLFLLALGADIFRGLRRLAGRMSGLPPETSQTSFSPGRRRAVMACLATVPAVCGVCNAVAVPEIRWLEARLPGLPKPLDGLSLVQVSDLHVSSLLHASRVRAVVEKINAMKPDLIVFTGDMVDGFPERRADGVSPLRDLRARHGIFACVGNHEYYADFRAWMGVFQRLGITMLLNSHVPLAIGGGTLVLAGVTDIVAERFGLPLPDVLAALEGAPKAFTVLLDHRPARAEVNAEAGVHLQLSGHTHGGQIFGMAKLVAAYNRGYLYDWYQIAGMRLYVSSGAGLWGGFPIRLGVPSEIVALALRCA
ncbi:MAG: metallophosphoesterase [Desulfovibrio sp.]|jgi:predicted MPP superfamily phosphohydrolase|nr:metallophosphoesterase [Desulfovibrio sp.]